jgi:hypothetical protein
VPDSFTSNRNLIQCQVGGDVGTWGTLLNNGDFAQLDLVLGATQPISITSADVTLSIAQWNNCAIKLTGALTGDHSLILPFNANSLTVAVGGLFVVDNQTTGAFNVTVKTAAAGSTGVTVSQGSRAYLYSDTVNVWYADDVATHIIPWAGNPNGFVAGSQASVNNPPSVVWDYTNAILYFCTTTGNAAAAVWSQPVSPVNRGFNAPINLALSVTHTGGNLLDVAVKTLIGTDPSIIDPVIVGFQNVSGANTTGAVDTVNITAALAMTTNATGASLASLNNTPFRLWIAIFNNAGTPILALRNCSTASGIFPLAEYGVASTVSISGAATSAGVWYTPNGVTLTNCAFRLIGYCEYTTGNLLATAGTYSADPSNVVIFGPGIKKPGDLVQSIYSTTSATKNVSSTAKVATDLTGNIVMNSAVNLVKVLALGNINTGNGVTQADGVNVTLWKNTGAVQVGNNQSIGSPGSGTANGAGTCNFALDGPAATNWPPTQYGIYIATTAGTPTWTFNGTNFSTPATTSVMTIEEIMG